MQYLDRLCEALRVAEERLATDGLSLTLINNDARDLFRRHWRDHELRIVDWDWTSDKHTPPKGLQVAIWFGDALCGLGSGKLGSSRCARLDYIEGFPGNHPLKGRIIRVGITCLETYGDLIGSEEVRIQDVFEPLIPSYTRYGYELASGGAKVHVMSKAMK